MSAPVRAWVDQQRNAGDGAARRRDLLALLLEQHGPLTLRELGRKSGLDITTIGTDLRRMAGDGIVSKEGDVFQLAEDL